MSRLKPIITRVSGVIANPAFFWGIMALLVLQAAWIALSGRYPMAFDENFHLGIIRLYSHHLSPFWNSHPAGADAFGAVSRDPSYLYHWLMSFPYRLVGTLTDSQAAQVIAMRFINIALFAAGLPLYRRLLLKTGASQALVNLCLAVFILIPIVPLLAAQINYDNLLLPLTALFLLLSVNFTRELGCHKRIDCRLLMTIVSLGLLTSLVKYAFLPVLLVVAVFIAVELRQKRPAKLAWTGRRGLWLLTILLVISLGLFIQRYGVNILRYHKPVPDCGEVLTVQQCSAYPPWNRDYSLRQSKPDNGASDSPLTFTADWFYGMWMRSFFAVDGPATHFQTRGPLVLPGIGAIVLSSSALAASVVCLRKVWRCYDGRTLWLFVSVTGVYVALLWLDEYHSFLQTGQAVAINGRYLLPVLPLILIILALGVNSFLKSRQLKLAYASAVLICMLWGGGALTYILRSNDAWYWPNQTVHDANHAVRNGVGPITPGYYSPNEFMGRN